jgi:hypothetical protein
MLTHDQHKTFQTKNRYKFEQIIDNTFTNTSIDNYDKAIIIAKAITDVTIKYIADNKLLPKEDIQHYQRILPDVLIKYIRAKLNRNSRNILKKELILSDIAYPFEIIFKNQHQTKNTVNHD